MFDMFRPVFGIVDCFQGPRVRKVILGVFIFIIFTYNWQIIDFIVFQLFDYILGMCKIDQFSLAIDVLGNKSSIRFVIRFGILVLLASKLWDGFVSRLVRTVSELKYGNYENMKSTRM